MQPYITLDLLVIGGASLDVYHLADGQTVHSPGGAGLYTALAAACARPSTSTSASFRSGLVSAQDVRVGMFAPRPDPIPDELRAVASRIEWIGPIVPPDQLPHFEIAHYGGGRAALLKASWGGEMLITPENFPFEQLDASIVHIAALRTAERQLNFAKAIQIRNAELGMQNDSSGARVFRIPQSAFRISAGTYGKICASEPDTVRELISSCDFFFLNENEANLLFGGADKVQVRPGQIIFVTLSERGALVIQGDHVTPVPGHPAVELDPTGAGDTFCGATLAAIARGEHPVRAAQSAVLLAAEMIGAVGPARLLSEQPAPQPAIDPRVRVDFDQVERIAQLIARLPDVQPFNFTGDLFPPVGHSAALDFFFAATLQQFGFWEFTPLPPLKSHPERTLTLNEVKGKWKSKDDFGGGTKMPLAFRGAGWEPGVRAYSHPMIAALDGRTLKGSDYLWAAYRRMLDRDASFFTPDRQAALTADELAAVVRADDGSNPMPAFDLHWQQAQAYGRDMQALGWTPQILSDLANRSTNPRTTFLSLLDHVGGYKEDPLRKKSMLLALILEQRPEKFLRHTHPGRNGGRASTPTSSPLTLRSVSAQHAPAVESKGAWSEAEPPVIDYHLMRSCLRTGLVEVIDPELRGKIAGREELSAQEEWAVRFAAYRAIQQVQEQSGRSMGAVDWFFFNARLRCPEMTEPECAKCAIDPVCAHLKGLFQPVRRTTFY